MKILKKIKILGETNEHNNCTGRCPVGTNWDVAYLLFHYIALWKLRNERSGNFRNLFTVNWMRYDKFKEGRKSENCIDNDYYRENVLFFDLVYVIY